MAHARNQKVDSENTAQDSLQELVRVLARKVVQDLVASSSRHTNEEDPA